MIDRARLEQWLVGREDEHCEFKTAQNQIDSDSLTDYCVALANEGGGHLVLGVTNVKPRRVVGSQACRNPEKTKQTLLDRIHIRVETQEIDFDGRRVLVFSVPSCPVGTPLQYKGRYLMRCGESLTAMTAERLKAILAEAQPDFSAMVRPGATLDDLDCAGVERLRSLWHRKSGNNDVRSLPLARLLAAAELIDDAGGVKLAALVLLGTPAALARHLAQAEVIFEYRSSSASIAYQQREEYRKGYFLFDDELWGKINLRNEVQPVRYGMFIGELQGFNEEVVREALLNAICHRDYRLGESILVRQYSDRLEIESPGGFPDNITPETILQRQYRRNRLIAEVLQKCGLVERSSQGVDKMFRLMIRESKRRPDYSGSDENRVLLRLYSEVQDPEFLSFMERVGREARLTLDVLDLVLLDDIRQGKKVSLEDDRVRQLRSWGLIEKVGRGRGTRYILSNAYYTAAGKKGVYTRERGLDRQTNKALILQHLENHGGRGTIQEFEEVFRTANLNRSQIHGLLQELREEGRLHYVGSKRKGFWQKTG